MSGRFAALPAPPDGEAPDDCRAHAPIRFLPQGGGVVARVGVIDCGVVRPNHGGRNVKFYWASYLPGGQHGGMPATSLEIGQDKLAAHIRDWFAACGVALPRAEGS
jgi:hypothetical protein